MKHRALLWASWALDLTYSEMRALEDDWLRYDLLLAAVSGRSLEGGS